MSYVHAYNLHLKSTAETCIHIMNAYQLDYNMYSKCICKHMEHRNGDTVTYSTSSMYRPIVKKHKIMPNHDLSNLQFAQVVNHEV
jgi:hypothetical protein